MTTVKTPKKLIEVALPLDKINVAAAREKSIRHGHPSTLHLWWARRPLAAARAVIFAQMVNDPGYQQGGGFKYGVNKERAAIERERLFKIIEDLVLWENTNNEEVLARARAEIVRSWRETCDLNRGHPQAAELFNPDKLPAFHDPFAGGGAIPLEAQRLGLEVYASDLNPVAVTINKAMIEIAPKFTRRAPVGPIPPATNQKTATRDAFEDWRGAKGLAEDVRRYGAWMREQAEQRIGRLYPKIEVTADMAKDRVDLLPFVGEQFTVVAWLWARTVRSPNPAFAHAEVPLASTFVLSSKDGKQAYVLPLVEGDGYRFTVMVGPPNEAAQDGTKAKGRGANFLCMLSSTPISGDYIKAEGQAGRMGARMMAIVAEGKRGRVYLAPTAQQETVAHQAAPDWKPGGSVPARLTGGTCVPYGLREWSDLFTPRQLVALTTFSDLVQQAIAKAHSDALVAGMADDGLGLDAGGAGAKAYAQAVGTLLTFSISRLADRLSTICTWDLREGQGRKSGVRNVFSRQAIPMSWDFAEANPLSGIAASADSAVDRIAEVIELATSEGVGFAMQGDAATQAISAGKVVSTDPPYYDNIGYADLSDFVYVWLRRSLRSVFPNLLSTISVPKAEELIATPYRHGTKEKAEKFFLDGMTRAMHSLAVQAHPAAPITIYYAFKQSETESVSGTASTGWETFLDAVLTSGLALTGTWPMRTERAGGFRNKGQNALASSIILVCRPRAADAGTISRRQFLRQLNEALPLALDAMTRASEGLHSPVAPVDLSQAIIGPGMAIFSRYDAVLEADGKPMSVKTALQLINRFLAEDDFDADTQFCLHWFEQHGWEAGKFGEADTLARAKGTSVEGVKGGGVIEAGGGSVRLLRWREYPADWNPRAGDRLPVWEALHQLIRAYNMDGDGGAARVLAAVAAKAEAARQLAYRLYTLCERANRAEDARAYNEVVTGWGGIESTAAKVVGLKQGTLFENE